MMCAIQLTLSCLGGTSSTFPRYHHLSQHQRNWSTPLIGLAHHLCVLSIYPRPILFNCVEDLMAHSVSVKSAGVLTDGSKMTHPKCQTLIVCLYSSQLVQRSWVHFKTEIWQNASLCFYSNRFIPVLWMIDLLFQRSAPVSNCKDRQVLWPNEPCLNVSWQPSGSSHNVAWAYRDSNYCRQIYDASYEEHPPTKSSQLLQRTLWNPSFVLIKNNKSPGCAGNILGTLHLSKLRLYYCVMQ